jgi:hypothetical protein
VIDWSKVPTNTEILVWQNGRENEKYRRHFQKFIDNKIYVCHSGKTTYTMKSIENVPIISIWDNAALYEETRMNDIINNPSHYTFGKYEVIEVINDWGLNYNKGNAVKYIARAGRKHKDTEIEDLKKAVFYLNYEIKRLEK